MADAPDAAAWLDQIAGEIKEHLGKAKSSFYEDAMGFFHAVDFSERWIQALLAFHVATFVVCMATRHRLNAQTALFLGLLGLTYAGEHLNGLGARHWRQFAGQDYFDRHGVFVAVMWSAPLLFNTLLVILLTLRAAAGLLVKVKRAEFAQERRRRAAQPANGRTHAKAE